MPGGRPIPGGGIGEGAGERCPPRPWDIGGRWPVAARTARRGWGGHVLGVLFLPDRRVRFRGTRVGIEPEGEDTTEWIEGVLVK